MDEFDWAVKQARKWIARRKKSVRKLDLRYYRPEALPSRDMQILRLEKLHDAHWETNMLEVKVTLDGTTSEMVITHNLGRAQIGE